MPSELLHRTIEKLSLDPQNPRLPEDQQHLEQPALTIYVANHYDSIDIARSIARYSYFPTEPLIGVEHEDGYQVIEGNRRLAALKLLTDETQRRDEELENQA